MASTAEETHTGQMNQEQYDKLIITLKEAILAQIRSEIRQQVFTEEFKAAQPRSTKVRAVREPRFSESNDEPKPKLNAESPDLSVHKGKSSYKHTTVVLDYQNIAMRHGKSEVFSCKGIRLAVNYFRKRGHDIIGFIPDYTMDRRKIAQKLEMKA